MIICPNKSNPLWSKLINDIKEKYGVDDDNADAMAHLAFFRYGDIPEKNKAFAYLDKRISKEEAQFDKWTNFGKKLFIDNQGELTDEDFKNKFKEKFGLVPDDKQLEQLKFESEKKYLQYKLIDDTFSNLVGEREYKKGDKTSFRDVIPWIKDYFVSNLNILGKYSQEAKDAAVKYFSSASQASPILRNAVNKIIREQGEQTWRELRKALVQSRLNGVEERWNLMADKVLSMSDVDFLKEFQLKDNNLLSLLSQLEGRTPLQDLVADVKDLILTNDLESAKKTVSDAFKFAADKVAKVDFSGGRTFEEIINDEKTKEALKTYKEFVEKPLSENHASSEGVFSNSLGDLDTYYPLIPLDDKARMFSLKRASSTMAKTKNVSNNFTTGLSDIYDTSVESLHNKLKLAFKANNKNAMVKTMESAGLIKPLSPFEKGSEVIVINGEEHPAVTIEVGERIIKDGKVIPPKRILVPKWLSKELRQTFSNVEDKRTLFGMIMDKITAFSLGGVIEPTIHTANLVGGIVNGTPFPGTSLASKTIGNVPITKVFTALINLATEDVTSDAAIKHMQEMTKIGLLPEKSGSTTLFKDVAEQIGAKYIPWYKSPSNLLYGRKGVDLKARVLMDRICLEINPKATPEERRRFGYQLGNYTKGLEGQLEKTVKSNGLAPFFTASSTFLKNGIKGWLGLTPLPTDGLSFGKIATMKAAQLLSSGAIGYVGMWAALYKAQTGKYPWDDKDSTFGKIPLNDEELNYIDENAPWMKSFLFKNGKRYDINMGFFNPNMERGSRALGINSMYDSYQQGADAGQILDAVKKDQINSFLTPLVSAPSIKFASTLLFGRSPYITALRDFNSGSNNPQFAQTVKTMDNSLKQFGANVAQGLMDINPLIGQLAESQGFSFKPKYQEEDKDAIRSLNMAVNIVFPRLFKPHIDNNKRSIQLAKQRKQIERESMREEGIKPPSKQRTHSSESDADERPSKKREVE
jgi:hypothetical protein